MKTKELKEKFEAEFQGGFTLLDVWNFFEPHLSPYELPTEEEKEELLKSHIAKHFDLLDPEIWESEIKAVSLHFKDGMKAITNLLKGER